jgi:hypothetical protein
MRIGSDCGRRVERALHLLDSLAAEAVSEGAYGAALSADQIRDVLLPLRAAVSAAADEDGSWAEQEAEAGGEADGHGEPCAHWVLMAQPQRESGAPLGCHPTPEMENLIVRLQALGGEPPASTSKAPPTSQCRGRSYGGLLPCDAIVERTRGRFRRRSPLGC